jgi:hypothetical protein
MESLERFFEFEGRGNFSTVPPQHHFIPAHLSIQSGFTISPHIKHPDVLHVPFEDKDLGVHNVWSGSSRRRVLVAPARLAWETVYRNGSVNPSGEIPGGFGLYMRGPQDWSDRLAEANEVLISYSVLFESDFDFVKGGKLCGVCE